MYILWIDIVFSSIFGLLIIFNLLQLFRSCSKWKASAALKKQNKLEERVKKRGSLNLHSDGNGFVNDLRGSLRGASDRQEEEDSSGVKAHYMLIYLNFMLTIGLLSKIRILTMCSPLRADRAVNDQ